MTENAQKTTTIGLVGGIASGKSLVARQFVQLGAGLIDADRAGHEALCRADVIRQARQRWGDSIIDEAGQVSRPALASIVFAENEHAPSELAYLEQITHPIIEQTLALQRETLHNSGKKVILLDAPLLIEADWLHLCDLVIMVDAPESVRLARALQRGWSKREFHAREAAQESLDLKRSIADIMVDNSGPEEETLCQVQRIWRRLTGELECEL